jgi:hypothetical protein
LPAIPAVVFTGKQPISGAPTYQLIPPSGGHTLLDLYFLAALPGVLHALGTDMVDLEDWNPLELDSELEGTTALAWRIAVAAVATRPDTGAVPKSLPAGGL